jgi:hypothetical protein
VYFVGNFKNKKVLICILNFQELLLQAFGDVWGRQERGPEAKPEIRLETKNSTGGKAENLIRILVL